MAEAGRLGTGAILSHKTFDAPETVKPENIDPKCIDLAALCIPELLVMTLALVPVGLRK